MTNHEAAYLALELVTQITEFFGWVQDECDKCIHNEEEVELTEDQQADADSLIRGLESVARVINSQKQDIEDDGGAIQSDDVHEPGVVARPLAES